MVALPSYSWFSVLYDGIIEISENKLAKGGKAYKSCKLLMMINLADVKQFKV